MSKKSPLTKGQQFALALDKEVHERLSKEGLAQPDGEKTVHFLESMVTMFQSIAVRFAAMTSNEMAHEVFLEGIRLHEAAKKDEENKNNSH